MLILVDQDGVLADFHAGFEHAWRAAGHALPPIPLAQRKSFYLREDYPAEWRAAVVETFTQPGFFRDLPPITGAVEALRSMLALGHEVAICTSPLLEYQHCVAEKYAWVEHHLGADFIPRIVLTRDKTLVHGDVLIDDKPVIDGLRRPDWRHLIYDQPYNRTATGPRLTWADWREKLGSAPQV